jgi:hypothetical protein
MDKQSCMFVYWMSNMYFSFSVCYLTNFSVAKIFSVDDGRKEAPVERAGSGMLGDQS